MLYVGMVQNLDSIKSAHYTLTPGFYVNRLRAGNVISTIPT